MCLDAEKSAACTIRQATVADIPEILECLRQAFEPYRTSYTPAAFEDTALTPATLGQRLTEMTVLVAVLESGETVGTIACKALADGEGHLRGMAVRPGWHGCGIARALLDRAQSELRECRCRRITLDTTEPLKRAVHFYEKNGFRASGRVTDFFGMRLTEYVKPL